MGTLGLVPWFCGDHDLIARWIINVMAAGRCISADHQVKGSVRIMACCLNTDEAAGIAAAMVALDPGNQNVHDADADDWEMAEAVRRIPA